MYSRSSRQVEIFNFSFLDILACTIGLLIFIMVMVFILQSNSPIADTGATIRRKLNEASMLTADALHNRAIASALEAQLNGLKVPEALDLTPQLAVARSDRDQSQKEYDSIAQQVADAQGRIDIARLQRDHSASAIEHSKDDLAQAQVRLLQAQNDLKQAMTESNRNTIVLSPYQRPGYAPEHFEVLHVDCQREEVVMYKADQTGKVIEVGHSSADSLSDEGSEFERIVAAHRLLDHAIVLFWVRPDGLATFDAALQHLPDSTEYGSEPANANWSFVAPGH